MSRPCRIQRLEAISALVDACFSDRPRNSDGQFQPEAAEGPDPSTMAAAYGAPPTQDPAPSDPADDISAQNDQDVEAAAASPGGTPAAAKGVARLLKSKGYRPFPPR